MNSCIFCKIASGEIPSNKVYEDEKVLAFRDIKPVAPLHILVVPKKHYVSIMDIPAEDMDITAHICSVIQKIAIDEGIAADGFRVVINCGKNGGQEVDHLHYHVLAGRNLTWPPG
ncbi:putative HIT-like protein [Peptoclostridium acidaminophilum DSM 3953]|uniref:Putative HIT-like protein n=1 Tax=Peptoclostridium acidaminophilum DSM 3953 TaxID=1286171 RepID=W8TKM3_PEPAC|nr:histidine triad nucleotide-binding protein [Peptoclostridium acidaminophilum]AHM56732.1 putative HIT-like protein [Peptoclostridium acidaminophilum DSM 3953]